ncbi:hypothetical protein HPP92_017559 [Vanilla planifolia]|uniref:Major facilitator superfamily (MFS) profile domain-containing protein n=1 Tax=Vanilla planifolia TaxID=51239 RepID=A0A835Q878_VANPL|nr:hypothetical protein HPP92_017559 [Vanilla planifolia]
MSIIRPSLLRLFPHPSRLSFPNPKARCPARSIYDRCTLHRFSRLSRGICQGPPRWGFRQSHVRSEVEDIPGTSYTTGVSRKSESASFFPEKEIQGPIWLEFITSERVKVVAMLGLALALCNADRVVMSVAIVPLSRVHGWTQSFSGIVQSSFLWGYLISPFFGGVLVDYYGGKVVLAWGVLLWSIATFLTPWAAQTSLLALLAVRVLLGIAEGVALPSMNNMVSRAIKSCWDCNGWIPTWLCHWTLHFPCNYVEGWNFWAFCDVWIAWVSLATGMVVWDLRLIPPLKRLLTKFPTWALMSANAMHSWGYFVILSWMPVYFNMIYGVDLRKAAWFSALPWFMMAVIGYAAGTVSDMLITRGVSITSTRKIMQTIGFVGPAIALLGLNAAKTPLVASIWLTAAVGLKSFSHSGFLVNFQEIAPQYAGVLHGMSNTAGTLAAIMGTVGAGFFVQKLGSFRGFIMLTSLLYLCSAVFWDLFSTGERVSFDADV